MYRYLVFINDYQYEFSDQYMMTTDLESAQSVMTFAVETHSHIPVNILDSLEGDFVSDTRFEGRVLYADDLPDGSDLDPETKRYVEVTINCHKI